MSDSWYCNICGLWSKQCEENYLCPRTIIKTLPKITIEDKSKGHDIDYFTFSSVVKAMKNYSELLHKAEHTVERKVIIEKYTIEKPQNPTIYETFKDIIK